MVASLIVGAPPSVRAQRAESEAPQDESPPSSPDVPSDGGSESDVAPGSDSGAPDSVPASEPDAAASEPDAAASEPDVVSAPGAATESPSEPEVAAETVEPDPGAIEDFDLESLLRDPVVTSSGGEAEERVVASGNVVVIRREDFTRNGWRTVADALASQAGIYVVDDLVVPSVGVRGVTGGLRAGTRIVRVMINGVPVGFLPDLTAFLGSEFIPIELVERVEIVQGPLSAVYGANAFLATVNVITRDATEQSTTEAAGRFLLTNGNPGFGLSAATIQGGADWGVVLGFSADWIDRSGLRITPTFVSQDATLERYRFLFADRTQGDASTPMSGFAQVHLGGIRGAYGRFTLQGGVQRLDSMAELQVSSVLSHRSRVAIDNFWIDLRHEAEWSELVSTTIDVGYSTGGPTRDMRLALAQNHDATWRPQFGYDAFNASAAVVISPLGRQLSFRVAADLLVDLENILYYRQTFSAPGEGGEPPATIDLISPSTDREQTITDFGVSLGVASVPLPTELPGLRLTGDLRVDLIRYGPIEYPAQVSWRAGVIYQWSPEVTTKIVGGQAFQTPSGVLMFAQGGFGIANNVLGNFDVNVLGVPPLRPQVVTGAEAIASLELLDRALAIDAGLYVQSVDDRIVFNQLATDFVAVNEAQATSMGVLLSARLTVDRLSAWTNVTGGVQVLESGISTRPPPQYPSIFGASGFDVTISEIHVRAGAGVRWAGERGATQSNSLLNDGRAYTLDPYALIDLTLSTVDLRVLGESETRIVVAIRNLLDTRYSEPYFAGYDLPSQGRTMWIELRQVF
ncbi:TonB-dependent receptor [Sandaracinus amylolyticus]|uniref:TonB-dependent receptor n=1 Tax=Sandaracinus amylolyticus TaxID=927083 RepID=A0A0F6W1B0_9BACT|nr:TonB-dependent receptor [Sandaracinus amylolyticus]